MFRDRGNTRQMKAESGAVLVQVGDLHIGANWLVSRHHRGRLDAESLGWLEHQLTSFPDTPTVLAMHHPPLLTGFPAWDRLALAAHSRHQLAQTLNRHPQVKHVLGARLHRPLVGQFGSRAVVIAPIHVLTKPTTK
jgi:3',5'-cyclic AMP phosphodiesterase CpdA